VTTGLQTASSGDMQQRLRRLPATQELASCAARSTHGSFCHMQQRLRRRPATQELASARRHARVSPDAAQPHADIRATRGMFPHAALGHARPATPTPAPTQHGRAHTSGHTGTQAHTHTHYTYPHITIGHARPDTSESAWTQHGRTQTSRPRAGCSHTQHWATHNRPHHSYLRRSTTAH